jgi:hypothetical protein
LWWHGGAGVEPGFFAFGQRLFEKVARSVKTQHRQPPLTRAAATGDGAGQVLKPQLAPQHGVGGFGQRGAFARPQLALLAEKTRHHGVCRVFQQQRAAHQFGGSI